MAAWLPASFSRESHVVVECAWAQSVMCVYVCIVCLLYCLDISIAGSKGWLLVLVAADG